jgi:hypothetical protein
MLGTRLAEPAIRKAHGSDIGDSFDLFAGKLAGWPAKAMLAGNV